MRTAEIIGALVEDHASQPKPMPIGRTLLMVIMIGFAVSAALLSIALGMRPDIVSALGTWRFAMKWIEVLVLVIVTAWAASRLSSPTTRLGTASRPLLVPALLLLTAVICELVSVPASVWLSRAMGMNGLMCVANLIFLSIVPFGIILYALRQGAPMSPAVTGAAGGLLAGAVGAAVYAMHCMDDSPLFVAIWYTLAIGLMTLAGLLIGRYVLRW
jgi:hypothetical protein